MRSLLLSMFLALAILLTYAEPFLLAALWGRKLYKPHTGGPVWRDVALWLSLAASTIAVMIFWGTMLDAYRLRIGRHFHFAHSSHISIGFAVAAFVAGLCGAGRSRKWVVIAALIVPLSWVGSGAIE